MKHLTLRSSVAMIIGLVVAGSVPAVSARTTQVGPTLVGSDWAANAARLRGHNGARFLFICPAGGPTGRLWGTGPYTDDSSVCTAAVQAGLLTVAHGGTVTIQMAPGMPSYLGYTWHGVTTRTYGHWRASFRFPGTPMLLPRDPRIPIGGMSW